MLMMIIDDDDDDDDDTDLQQIYNRSNPMLQTLVQSLH